MNKKFCLCIGSVTRGQRTESGKALVYVMSPSAPTGSLGVGLPVLRANCGTVQLFSQEADLCEKYL